jgi:hypothetical protein
MSAFVPCPGCRRHVRSSEARCVFCGGDLTSRGSAGAATSAAAILSVAALGLMACNENGPAARPEPPAATVTVAPADDPPPASVPPVEPQPVSADDADDPPKDSPLAASDAAAPVAPQPERPFAARYGMPPNRQPIKPPTPDRP